MTRAGMDLDQIDGLLEELWQMSVRHDPRLNGTVAKELEGLEDQKARDAVLERHEWEHVVRIGQRMAVQWMRGKLDRLAASPDPEGPSDAVDR